MPTLYELVLGNLNDRRLLLYEQTVLTEESSSNNKAKDRSIMPLEGMRVRDRRGSWNILSWLLEVTIVGVCVCELC